MVSNQHQARKTVGLMDQDSQLTELFVYQSLGDLHSNHWFGAVPPSGISSFFHATLVAPVINFAAFTCMPHATLTIVMFCLMTSP